MLDKKYIGHAFAPFRVLVEEGPLRFFRQVIGVPDTVMPPTYLFTLESTDGNSFEVLKLLNIDFGNILHGEQSFQYFQPYAVGDHLIFSAKITSIYEKKSGALWFVQQQTEVTNQDSVLIAHLGCVLVVVNE